MNIDRAPVKKSFTTNDFTFIDEPKCQKFGVTFKAVEKQSNQTVNLKVLPKKHYQNQEMYERLRREIQVHSRLKYPHIRQLYCYFHQHFSVYLVTQFCPNGNLYEEVRIKGKVFLFKDIARIMYQLLHALWYLHERHVIHRDIKLENLLLDDKGNIKLGDFSCCAHTVDPQDTFVGTFEYLAPQILESLKYNQKVDIYSAGIIFYELFFLRTPFEADKNGATSDLIKGNKVIFNEKAREIPNSAKSLILEMLWKDPSKRPSAQQALKHKFFQEYYNGPIYQQKEPEKEKQQIVKPLK